MTISISIRMLVLHPSFYTGSEVKYAECVNVCVCLITYSASSISRCEECLLLWGFKTVRLRNFCKWNTHHLHWMPSNCWHRQNVRDT